MAQQPVGLAELKSPLCMAVLVYFPYHLQLVTYILLCKLSEQGSYILGV